MDLADPALAGSGQVGVIVALLLGVGWNAGLIGGSALLRDAPVSPSMRTRAEGLGEPGMGAAAAAGGSGAGLLLATGGFGLLALVAVTPCLLLIAVAAGGRRQSDARPTGSVLDSLGNQGRNAIPARAQAASTSSAARSARW
jgi:predicted MFS family arabinose efflux permease